MTKVIILSMYVAASVLSFNARAQSSRDERQYAEGPVTLVPEIPIEYGHFEDYMWKGEMKNTRTKDERQYTEGPVTNVAYIRVEYGRFEEYVDWLNSTWKPTLEAMKKAGLIIDYKIFKATPKSPGQPNIILWITFKNAAAALDKGVELEEVAKKVIGSTDVQNKARVGRNDYRKLLGTEL